MKICYLSDANSTHTKKWCAFFKNLGYEIEVISLNNGDIPGVKVHSLQLNIDNSNDRVLSKVNYMLYGRRVRKLINQIKPDILHAHYATSYGYLGRISGFHPYVLSVWGSDVYDFPNHNIICKKFVEGNLKRADLVLSTSKVMAEETRKYTNKEIEITPFGVDTNIFKPIEGVAKDKESLVIGTVKTLEKKYGISYLIEAFGAVAKKHPNVYLEIAGTGSQKEELLELCKELGIEDRVKFLGFINQEQVIEAFNRFDIAVFPSTLDSESFGVAAVEAQACGCPTIVSNVGGLPEATDPGMSSIVVPKENVKALEEAIERLVDNDELRRSMGRHGRQFVIDNYNVHDNFKRVDELYKALLKSRL